MVTWLLPSLLSSLAHALLGKLEFKLITISAGTFNNNFFMFLIASAISRSARFFIVALLIRVYGEPIRNFIENYFNLLAVIFTILLLGGFILIKFIMN